MDEMESVESEIQVEVPAEVVFRAVTDPRRAGEWHPNVIEVSDVTPYPVEEGSKWNQVTMIGGRPVRNACRVTAFDPPTFGILEISGGYRGRVTTRCVESNGGTLVRQVLEFEPPGGLGGKLGAKIVQPLVRRELVQSMDRMKRVLEDQDVGGSDGSRTS